MKCRRHPNIEAVSGNLCGLCYLLEDKKHNAMTSEERKEFEKKYK